MPSENTEELLPVLGQMGIHSQTLRGREQSNGARKLVETHHRYVIYCGVDVGKELVTLQSIQHGARQRPVEEA